MYSIRWRKKATPYNSQPPRLQFTRHVYKTIMSRLQNADVSETKNSMPKPTKCQANRYNVIFNLSTIGMNELTLSQQDQQELTARVSTATAVRVAKLADFMLCTISIVIQNWEAAQWQFGLGRFL